MKVHFPRKLAAEFRKTARSGFPKERYAILLGAANGASVHIDMLFIPDTQEYWAKESHICVPNGWWDKAEQMANQFELKIVGDLHSHCANPKLTLDCSPSEKDWEHASEVGPVHGVMTLQKHASGRITSKVRFWPSDIEKVETRVT